LGTHQDNKVDWVVVAAIAVIGALALYGVGMWIYTFWSFLEPMNH
jgi:uncharacterized membrane protein